MKLFIRLFRLMYITVTDKRRSAAVPLRMRDKRQIGFSARRKEAVPLKHLVKKAQQGDAQAFVQLIKINKQTMYKITRSYISNDEDIADAIQDTIETCWRSVGNLTGAEYFRTWMTRILINNCINIIRRNKREHPVNEFPEYGKASAEIDNYEFNELMDSLDEKYRTILLLYYGEGFKISEIAQLLDIEENTVKTRLSRGRMKFREIWTGLDNTKQH